MLVARKASCRVANAFSTRLKLIWPRSSLKTSKMSKKCIFWQKKSRSPQVKISENVYFTGVCVKCPRKAVARNGGHLEYSDTLKGHFKCAWIHYKSILKLCHQPDNLLIRETLGNPSLQTRLDTEFSYSHDILQPSACLAIAIGHTHHLQFGVKIEGTVFWYWMYSYIDLY